MSSGLSHTIYMRSFRASHPEYREYLRNYCRKWRKEHKSYMESYSKSYYSRNKERYSSYIQTLKLRIVQKLGGKCVGCGVTDPRILTLNHKNGGGTKHRETKNSYGIYRDILFGREPLNDYDLRCYNCNILYEYERGARKPFMAVLNK